MNLQLEGKRALVTGSTAGIGFAIARRLAGEGASVIVNGRTPERVEQAIRQIKQSEPRARVSGVAADLATAAGCGRLVRRFQPWTSSSTTASATNGAALRVDGGVVRAIL